MSEGYLYTDNRFQNRFHHFSMENFTLANGVTSVIILPPGTITAEMGIRIAITISYAIMVILRGQIPSYLCSFLETF